MNTVTLAQLIFATPKGRFEFRVNETRIQQFLPSEVFILKHQGSWRITTWGPPGESTGMYL